MASLGSQVTLSAPLRIARAYPWRVDDPTDASCVSSLPRLHAQCVARGSPHGRRVAPHGTGAMELEIDGDDARVVSLVHGASHVVDRVFRFATPVLDAALVQFARRQHGLDRKSRHRQRRHGDHHEPFSVCILSRSDCVSVFAPHGESFEVALPFHADRLLALPAALGGGLVLQRRPLTPAPSAAATAAAFSPSHVRSPSGSRRASSAPVVTAARPRYFTLAHPLEEVKPIALTPPRSATTAAFGRQQPPAKTLAFLSEPALDLVQVCAFPTQDQGQDSGMSQGGYTRRLDEPLQRALVVCFHRHERRFVVYEMARHVHEPSQTTRGPDGGTSQFDTAAPATPTSFVSPAKARQQQREVAMMEQYFKSHIVPDFAVRLVWTTPSLDALAESHAVSLPRAQSTQTSGLQGHDRCAFLIEGGDEAKSDDPFNAGDEIAYRLGILDESSGLLLLKPVRSAINDDDNNETFLDREDDLHVVRCQSASPLILRSGERTPKESSTVATEVIISTRDGAKLLLYSAGVFIAELTLPDRGVRVEPIQLYASSAASKNFVVALDSRRGRCEYRQFSHPLQVERSSLLRSVMEVLRYVMTKTEYLAIHVATLATATTRYVPHTSPRRVGFVEDDQWWAFQRIMRAIIAKATGRIHDETVEHGAPKKARATLGREVSPDDAEMDLLGKVLQSEFATAYTSQHSAVFASIGGLPSCPSTRRQGEKLDAYVALLDGVDVSTDTIGRMLAALHLLHEDFRLSLARHHDAILLARLQHEICSSADLHHLASYYRCQYSSIPCFRPQHRQLPNLARVDIPVSFDDEALAPDIYLWLRERLQGSSSSGHSRGGGGSFEPVTSHVSSPPFPRLEGINDWKRALHSNTTSYPLWRTDAVCRVYELLFPVDDEDDDMQGKQTYDITRLTELMEYLTADAVGKRLSLEDLPLGIRFVVLEAIRVYRENPPHDASELVCEFIGRRDLAGTFRCDADDLNSAVGSTTSGSLVESTRLRSGWRNKQADTELSSNPEVREVPDGLMDVVTRSQRLFPDDQRLKEVARLLRSNRPLCLRLEKTSDMTDQDFVAQQQARLLQLCKRSMALSVARGMVTLGTFDMAAVQNQAWQLSVPALPLAGRTPPTNATVLLDVSGYAKELTHWPQFHNGCATGLRLPGKDLSNIVTRYWIKYHRPSASEFQRLASQGMRAAGNQASSTATARDIDEARAAHAGLLLGLGLNGHLKCLTMADVFNYLSISNEFITVAILLGMATTAARGRRRKRVSSASAALQAARRRRRRELYAGTAPDVVTQDDGQLPTASQVADTDVDMDANIPASAAQEAPPEDTPNVTPLVAAAGAELSLERSVSKMLCLHIPALLPPAFPEFSVPASTQTAALLGLGILYQGSGHRLMTELLLTEITRSPASPQFLSSQNSASSASSTSSSTPFDQHESYSLAAGLGLGLVLLGRGGVTAGDPGLADLGLEEKLYKYIVGGAIQPFPATGGDVNASGSYLYRGRKWKPFGSGHSGGNRPRGNSMNNSSTNLNRDATKGAGDRNSCRGEYVNIGVTACGSALALAFMYMKSGNRSIASQLAVPDTLILLDYVRPDILMVRTLAKNLVLWDFIKPTAAWVEGTEVPLQLHEAYTLLYDHSADAGIARHLPAHADVRSICESHANIVAGACFSIGLRFAGTGDSSARETLRRYLIQFRDMRSRTALLGTDIVVAATDRVTIERCLAVCAQSLALVDAGTGNLETLTLLRSINLRQRVDNELTYGNHMALSTAIGLLFLGGGRATVSRSKDAIAALVVSLYPVSAMNTADNKHHLQAFRHLYTLAVDVSRYVETVDTTTGESCSVELRVESHQDGPNGTIVMSTSTLKTPCLLPEIDSIDRIIVNSPDFYPVDIRLQDNGVDDDQGSAWGAAGWSAYGARGPRTTANDNRVQLLLEKSRILLERRLEMPRRSMVSAEPLNQDVLVGRAGQHWHAFHQYFTTRTSTRRFGFQEPQDTGDDGASDWWEHQLRSKQLPLQASPAGILQTHLGMLFEVFSTQHPRRRLDSLSGVWNLKLIHEFHRMDPFHTIERLHAAPLDGAVHHQHRLRDGAGEGEDDAKRDFAEWLQGQTEDALRHRWRHEATTTFSSLSAVQNALLDSTHSDTSTSVNVLVATRNQIDAMLMSALFVFFDAPPSVYHDPSEWKSRMQRIVAAASGRSAARGVAMMTGFSVDRFLQQPGHSDQVTKEEQTFWLRVVSCFLFSV